MASLLITLGDAEAATLAKAYLAGRPGYLRSVDALLETAADVADDTDATCPSSVAATRATLQQIGADVAECVRQAAHYLKPRGASQ